MKYHKLKFAFIEPFFLSIIQYFITISFWNVDIGFKTGSVLRDFYQMHPVLPIVHLEAEVQKFLHLDSRIEKDWVF